MDVNHAVQTGSDTEAKQTTDLQATISLNQTTLESEPLIKAVSCC